MHGALRPQRRRNTYLIVLHGMREGAVFELTVGESTIGRGRRVDVRLEDEGISRAHAKVVRDGDGSVKIVDLGSTNGTFVNGRRVDAEGLRDGDRIRIGPTTVIGLRFAHPATGPHREAEPRAEVEAAAERVPAPARARSEEPAEHGGSSGYDPAIEVHLHTLRLRERALGRDHADLVEVLETLGAALLERGSAEPAERYLGRALRILEQHPSSSPAVLGRLHFRLGACAQRRGRPLMAMEQLERAQALLAAHAPGSPVLAETWFALARALQAAGQGPDRRIMLARRALDACLGDPKLRRLQARISRWLDVHER
ncbi:MAG: FHA domain-containing protein [Myxococcales bacterium]|nr:FHA domain-containing protein [Myxococcales bacterium]MCB9713846.1 FHA domain-containing protein [Myxococcales bacterium]